MSFILCRLSKLPIEVASALIFLMPIATKAAELPQLTKLIATLDLIYSAGTIQSATMAEQAIVEAGTAKNDLLKWYTQAEQTCAEKFFVTSCLNDIKLVRRDQLSILQRINVEAKAWQRRQRIDKLDEKLQEKNSQK